MEKKPKIVIILGPTAVGKTELSLDLAESFEGEIISADSMQVYRHLDIGTSKPSAAERARVPHHLIDIVEPDEDFSAAHFFAEASEAIRLLGEGKHPFVVGGTGLYIRALTGGIIEGPEEERRRRYREELKKADSADLHGRLREVDPEAAERIHPRDRVRIVRALEMAELSGEPISARQKRHGFRDARYESLKIGLYRDREELYGRIDRRATEMIEAGLVEETRRVLQLGYAQNIKPLQSLGYKYFIQHLKGKMTLEEAVGAMRRDTRHYARRQMTWFRGESDIEWFHPAEAGAIRGRIERFLTGR